MTSSRPGLKVRGAAFEWLREQVDIHGDILPRKILSDGFLLDGERVPLMGPQNLERRYEIFLRAGGG